MSYYKYSIILTMKDGRKCAGIIRFEASYNMLAYNLGENVLKALSSVNSGKQLLSALDDNAGSPYFTDKDFWSGESWCNRNEAAIQRITEIGVFEHVAAVTIHEQIGWSDGEGMGSHITINEKNNEHITASVENRAENVKKSDWRKLFKFSLQSNVGPDDGWDGFESIAVISGYRGEQSDVIIPRYLESHKVIAVAKDTFKNLDHIESVIIPDGVLEINYRAFNNCPNLKKVVIPRAVIAVDSDFLYRCPNATLIIPEDSPILSVAKENNIPFEVYTETPYDYIAEMNAFLQRKGGKDV